MENSELVVVCEGVDKHSNDCSIDLNLILGNNNGELQWGGTEFMLTAKDVVVDSKGMLGANLSTENGDWNLAKIDLNE